MQTPTEAGPDSGPPDEDDIILIAPEDAQAPGHPTAHVAAATHRDAPTAAEGSKPGMQPPKGSHGTGNASVAVHPSFNGTFVAAQAVQCAVAATAPAHTPTKQQKSPSQTTKIAPGAVKRCTIADLADVLAFGAPAGGTSPPRSGAASGIRPINQLKAPPRKGTHPMMSKKRALDAIPPVIGNVCI